MKIVESYVVYYEYKFTKMHLTSSGRYFIELNNSLGTRYSPELTELNPSIAQSLIH